MTSGVALNVTQSRDTGRPKRGPENKAAMVQLGLDQRGKDLAKGEERTKALRNASASFYNITTIIAQSSQHTNHKDKSKGLSRKNKSGTHTEEKGESVNNRPSNATKGQEKQSAKTKKTKGKHR